MKELERSLGPVGVTALSIGAMLGSGIFVLPGLAASLAGSSAWLAYVLAGVCVFPAAACKAELATAMPTSGGTYVYIDRIFGPWAGTIAGVALWLSLLLKSAFALLGLGTYLVTISQLDAKVVALGVLALITGLNLVGVRNLSRVQTAVLIASVGMLVVLGALGVPTISEARLAPFAPHGISGVLVAVALVFVSYNGVTKIAAVAEEVRNPGRNIPIGILTSLSIALVLYTGTALVLVGNVDRSELGHALHPIYLLAVAVGGRSLGVVVSVVAIVTMASMANVGLLASSRFPFAMSRDGLLPPSLARVSSRFGTPFVTIAITGVAMGLAMAFLDVEALAKLASSILIGLFITVNLVVVVFRESRVSWYQPAYRAPLYPGLQLFGVLTGLLLLAMLGTSTLLAYTGVLAAGTLVFLLYGRKKTARRGVMRLRLRRPEALLQPRLEGAEPVRGPSAVVVALFGNERSPETLAEVGTALADGGKVQVVHLTEVPEQMFMGAAIEEDPIVRSLRRRLGAMAEEQQVNLEFHAIASRDIAHTTHSLTRRVECRWTVIEWRGKRRRTLLPYNPLGWLINHLDANLALFRDKGIRNIREILTYPEPGPNDALVVSTADHLASLLGANLTLVRFVHDRADPTELQAEVDYLEQLATMSESPCRALVTRGAQRVAALTTLTASHDLLVASAPDITLANMLVSTEQERIARGAACSVLTLKTPRGRTHEAFEDKRSSVGGGACYLPEFIAEGAVAAGLSATKKDVLFQHFANAFASVVDTVSAKHITEALWERERTQNTAVGHGVALPHATISSAGRAWVGVFTTRQPVEYRAPDGEPVDVFIVTLCPPSERQTHLLLLSGIARLSLKTDLLARLRAAASSSEIIRAIEACSQQLE